MIVAHFQTATEYVALHALTLEPFVRLTIFFPPHDLWSLSFSRDRSVEKNWNDTKIGTIQKNHKIKNSSEQATLKDDF